jgi:hypothetical protein
MANDFNKWKQDMEDWLKALIEWQELHPGTDWLQALSQQTESDDGGDRPPTPPKNP